MKTITTLLLLIASIAISAQSPNNCECIVTDNGTGTIDIPPLCADSTDFGNPLSIIDGLPPGTTIEIAGVIHNHMALVSAPGGSLGGETHQFTASLQLEMTGTGALAGFNRLIQVPLMVQMETAPRNPGDPVQSFPLDIFQLQGQIVGDPDFDVLQIIAGTAYGLPSPGHMTLTAVPGEFNVESFYDLSYQIGFTGAPGSVLDGLSGSTQASSRFSVGSECDLPPIPTLTQWGIVILSLFMLVLGLVVVRKQVNNRIVSEA